MIDPQVEILENLVAFYTNMASSFVKLHQRVEIVKEVLKLTVLHLKNIMLPL